MRFKLFGTEIYISFLFAAVITAMLAFDRTGLIIPALFAIVVHELGQLFAMWVLECQPKRIRLVPAAVEITNKMPTRHRNDIIIAACGPAVNLIIFFTLYFNYLAFGQESSLYYAMINLLIGAFNLLPVTGLDGGNILFALLSKKLEPGRAVLVMRIITLAFAAGVIIAAVTLAFSGKFNLSFFIVGLYLAVMGLIKI